MYPARLSFTVNYIHKHKRTLCLLPTQPLSRRSPCSTSGQSIHIAAFTLLEIMIAIFIFAIVVTTIFGSFHYLYARPESLKQELQNYAMIKNCFDRMAADLESLKITPSIFYKPPDMDSDPDPYRLVGDGYPANDPDLGRLRFASNAHLPLGKDTREGVAEIIYYLQESETEGEGYLLRRSDQLPPFQPFEEKSGDPLLCERVKRLSFIYIDEEDEEREQWDSEEDNYAYATPRIIRIQLELLTVVEEDEEPRSLLFETQVRLPLWREGRE